MAYDPKTIAAFRALREAFYRVAMLSNDDRTALAVFDGEYPFDLSFGDMTAAVDEWLDPFLNPVE